MTEPIRLEFAHNQHATPSARARTEAWWREHAQTPAAVADLLRRLRGTPGIVITGPGIGDT